MATMTKRNPIKALLIKVRSEAERAARKLGLTGNIVAAADAEIEFWASYANDGKVDTWRDSFPGTDREPHQIALRDRRSAG